MATQTKETKPAKKIPMQKCKYCGEALPSNQMFAHWNEKHPEKVQESRRRGGQNRAKAAKVAGGNAGGDGGGDGGGSGGNNAGKNEVQETPKIKLPKSTTSLVEAAMVEFIGQSIQIPNTPALIYGYFCAKKMGFEGSLGEFIQAVIDDFFESRGINYYKEALRWEEVGKIQSRQGETAVAAVAAEKV